MIPQITARPLSIICQEFFSKHCQDRLNIETLRFCDEDATFHGEVHLYGASKSGKTTVVDRLEKFVLHLTDNLHTLDKTRILDSFINQLRDNPEARGNEVSEEKLPPIAKLASLHRILSNERRIVWHFAAPSIDSKLINTVHSLYNDAFASPLSPVEKCHRPLIVFEYRRPIERSYTTGNQNMATRDAEALVEQKYAFSRPDPTAEPKNFPYLTPLADDSKEIKIRLKGLNRENALNLVGEVLNRIRTRPLRDAPATISEEKIEEIKRTIVEYCGGHLGALVMVLERLEVTLHRFHDDDEFEDFLRKDLNDERETISDLAAEIAASVQLTEDIIKEWPDTKVNPGLMLDWKKDQLVIENDEAELLIKLFSIAYPREVTPRQPGAFQRTGNGDTPLTSGTADRAQPLVDPDTLNRLGPAIAVLADWYRNGDRRPYVERYFAKVIDDASFQSLIKSDLDADLGSEALQILGSQTQEDSESLLRRIRTGITKILRPHPSGFSKADLEPFWQDYHDTEETFQDMCARVNGQTGAAYEIAKAATKGEDRKWLAELLNAIIEKIVISQ